MKKTVVGVLVFIFSFVALKYANLTVKGVQNGIELCLETVIPSLFIFAFIAEFLSKSDVLGFLFRPLNFISYFFKIPAETVPVFVLSLVGGYPVGAQMIKNFIENKNISKELGEVLLCSCVNCSPAFLAGAVGIYLFNNANIGLFIWVCQVISAFIIGIMARGFIKDTKKYLFCKNNGKVFGNYSETFVNSVLGAAKTMFKISGFVIFFSVVIKFLPEFLSGFTEVSVGCAALREKPFKKALLLSCLYTAFGGISVFVQIKSFLPKLNFKKFFLMRILYTAISVLLTFFGIRFFNISSEVFANVSNTLPSNASNSIIASVFLVLLCFMLLITKKGYGIIKENY